MLAIEYCKMLEREGMDTGVEVDKERNREMVAVCGSMRTGYDSVVDFIRERVKSFNRARAERQREIEAKRRRIEAEKAEAAEAKAKARFAADIRKKYDKWRRKG